MTEIVFVLAVARNGVIGAAGGLPWRLPSDLKRFREATWGRPMIMGRKTFQSIGKPLPGRESIVVTRDASFHAEGVHVARDIDEAVAIGAERAAAMGVGEVMVIGGGEIYRALLPRADRIVLTEVDIAPAGDATFPKLDDSVWREVSRSAPERGPRDEAAFTIRVLERKQ
ncbi:MAG: dihydrofolate reductase [Hyphomicrobiales bacterium]|nr:dihydrofolate reductase [Hyphomicrobiales bacterium]